MSSKVIKVDALARVEGEGAMLIKVKDRKVREAKFRIYEPPRFFEAFLRGRKYSEAPDITARPGQQPDLPENHHPAGQQRRAALALATRG